MLRVHSFIFGGKLTHRNYLLNPKMEAPDSCRGNRERATMSSPSTTSPHAAGAIHGSHCDLIEGEGRGDGVPSSVPFLGCAQSSRVLWAHLRHVNFGRVLSVELGVVVSISVREAESCIHCGLHHRFFRLPKEMHSLQRPFSHVCEKRIVIRSHKTGFAICFEEEK